MKVCVGSTNPVKVGAAEKVFREKWPDAEVIGCEVESGVASQPFSDEETRIGAVNRAKAALKKGQRENSDEEVLGIGLEGGVFENDHHELWGTVWVAVAEPNGQVWEANGGRIRIPDIIADKIKQGQEMGHAVAELINQENVKQKQGMYGVISNNFINRGEGYAAIAKLAVGLWYGQNWVQDLNLQK